VGPINITYTQTVIEPDTPSLEFPGVMHYRLLLDIIVCTCSGPLHRDI